MDRKEAILRIKDHMEHHGIGKYPHLKLKEALDMAIAALSQPNEPLTWEELKSKTKINPVYSMKYGWIFPSTVKDEPYKQVWFFTSKGFANTELFYRDTFYRRPPEGEEDT